MSISIRLKPETEQRLAHLAAPTGHTKAHHLCEIIERGFEDVEDYYLAAEVLERVRRGQELVHSTVRGDLGLSCE